MEVDYPTAGASYLNVSNLKKAYKAGKQAGKLARELYNSMSKRKSVGARRSDGGVKRRKVVAQATTRRRSDVPKVTNNATTGASRQKGFSARKKGVKKNVKVPPKLRKQVKQILENVAAKGKYMDIRYWSFSPGEPFQGSGLKDNQAIETCGSVIVDGGNDPRLIFDPLYLRYAVSRLHGTMPAIQNPTKTELLTTYDANQLDLGTARINVLKQSMTFRIRNNAPRKATIKIYCLSPKSVNYTDTLGQNAFTLWNDGMANQNVGPTEERLNPFPTTPFHLHCTPKWCERVKQFYTIDETIVELEAGKEYNYKVDGPNMMYDYSKFFKDSNFYNQQKFTKQVMFVGYLDLVRTNAAAPAPVGRYTDYATSSPHSILIESTYFVKYQIPEQVGFIYPSSTTSGTLQNRGLVKPAYGIWTWQNIQSGTVNDYINDENPAVDTTTA